MDEALKKDILRNAERLLSDAELLLAAERFPTATSLAVLSMEELGKIASGMSEHHNDKQSAAVKDAVGDLFLFSLQRLGFKQAGDLVQPPPTGDITQEEHRAYLSDQIAEDFMNSPLREMVELVLTKRYNDLKKAGFYFDFAADGSVKQSPFDISRQDAEKVVKAARLLVDRITQRLR